MQEVLEGARFLFPFLILGKTAEHAIVSPLSVRIDPQTHDVTLSVSADYRDQDVSFVFPTCDNTYSEVRVEGGCKRNFMGKREDKMF